MTIKSEREFDSAVVDITPLKLDRITEKYIYRFSGRVCPFVNKVVTRIPGLKKLKNGDNGNNHFSDSSHSVQEYPEGHGYAKKMHEDPQIPKFGIPGYGLRSKSGMSLVIESMINLGTYEIDPFGPSYWRYAS